MGCCDGVPLVGGGGIRFCALAVFIQSAKKDLGFDIEVMGQVLHQFGAFGAIRPDAIPLNIHQAEKHLCPRASVACQPFDGWHRRLLVTSYQLGDGRVYRGETFRGIGDGSLCNCGLLHQQET